MKLNEYIEVLEHTVRLLYMHRDKCITKSEHGMAETYADRASIYESVVKDLKDIVV